MAKYAISSILVRVALGLAAISTPQTRPSVVCDLKAECESLCDVIIPNRLQRRVVQFKSDIQ